MEFQSRTAEATVKSVDMKERTVDVTVSTSAEDRHGTVLNQENWSIEGYKANPVIGYEHPFFGGLCEKADPDDNIGYSDVYFDETGEGKRMGAKLHFESASLNPRADKILRKMNNGSLRAVSVGFIPIEDEKGEIGRYGIAGEDGEIENEKTFYYHGQELLEISVVNIPSNPEAVMKVMNERSSRAMDFLKRNFGETYSYADIESMKVRDVLRFMQTGKKPPKRSFVIDEKHPLADRKWDADGAEMRVRKWASVDGSGDKDKINWGQYKKAFVISSGEEDFDSYKFIHHDVINGELVTIPEGIKEIGSFIGESKNILGMSKEDLYRTRSHLDKHYEEIGEIPPWDEESNGADSPGLFYKELKLKLLNTKLKEDGHSND